MQLGAEALSATAAAVAAASAATTVATTARRSAGNGDAHAVAIVDLVQLNARGRLLDADARGQDVLHQGRLRVYLEKHEERGSVTKTP